MSFWTSFRDKVLRPVAAVAAQSNPWTAPLAGMIVPRSKGRQPQQSSQVVPHAVTPINPRSVAIGDLLRQILSGDLVEQIERSLPGKVVEKIAKDKAQYDYEDLYRPGRTPEEINRIVTKRAKGTGAVDKTEGSSGLAYGAKASTKPGKPRTRRRRK